MQPPEGILIQETLDAIEYRFSLETDSDLREGLGILLGLLGFLMLLVVLFLFLLLMPYIFDPEATMMLFLTLSSVIGVTFLLNFGPFLRELSADPCTLRLTGAQLQFTLGRWQTQCLLEDIQSARAIDGRLEVTARDGSMRVLIEDGPPEYTHWLAEAIQQSTARRQCALAAEGHDLEGIATPPPALSQMVARVKDPR